MKPGVEALRALPVIGGFEPRVLAELNETADLARLGPGDTLFRPGERLAELSFLVTGQVGATYPRRDGELALIDVLLPVRPLCLPAALLGLPTTVGAQTLTSARLIILPLPDLQASLRDAPSLEPPLLEYALSETHGLAQQINILKSRSSAQRLALYLLELADETEAGPARFVLPFEKRVLAARIGCTQENLSRAFAALRHIGIETQRGVVVVRDIHALRAFSGASSAV